MGPITISNSTLGPTPHDNFGVGIGSGTSTWSITNTVFTGSVQNSGLQLRDPQCDREQLHDRRQRVPESVRRRHADAAGEQRHREPDSRPFRTARSPATTSHLDLNHDGTGTITYRVLNNTFRNSAEPRRSTSSPPRCRRRPPAARCNGRFVGQRDRVSGDFKFWFRARQRHPRQHQRRGGRDRARRQQHHPADSERPRHRSHLPQRHRRCATSRSPTTSEYRLRHHTAERGFSLPRISSLQSNCVTVCNTLRAPMCV